MEPIGFDGQVAIVTGGGRGIGRSHSLELARRGASVVVNDLTREWADQVVAEIADAGGNAVASYGSVAEPEGAREIVDVALERFGTIDALVNNAGIMRNGWIEDLTIEQLDAVLDVNLRGSFLVTQAAWPVLKAKGYGRVVMTSSSGGMFAMQGESNYAAAKAGVYGLCKALAVEGRDHGILVNAVLPMAESKITDGDPVPGHAERYPTGVREILAPRRLADAVAPLVALLASRACELTGEAYFAGFGRYARVFVGEVPGWVAADLSAVSAEAILEHIDEIRDLDGFVVPADIYEEVEHIASMLGVTPQA
jgi:NAD(P)-dependent dehydrogenase (short-subunit alcohol dehydrogenase family)